MDDISNVLDDVSQEYNVELNSMFTGGIFAADLSLLGISPELFKSYIKYPMRFNLQIRKISRELYSLNGQYTNIVDYCVSIIKLDYITSCMDGSLESNKKRLKFNQILKNMNHKLTTRDIILSLLIDGIYVGYLRDTKPNNPNLTIQPGLVQSLDILEGLSTSNSLMIQPLYTDFIKVIGFQNNDYLVAFDMMYFNQFVGNNLLGEIKNFPPEFIKGYLDFKKDGFKRWLILDQSKTIVLKFKSNINEPWGRPLAISVLNDMLFYDEYIDGQRSNFSETSRTVRWLQQPEGKTQGQCSLNKEQQTNQYNNFKNAIYSGHFNRDKMGKTTTLVLAPGTEVGKLDNDTSLLKDTLTDEITKRISTGVGFAVSALNGDSGANYSTLQINIKLVLSQMYQVIEQVSYQYTKVLNNLLFNGKQVIEFNYMRTSLLTQEEDIGNAKDLYTLAGGSRLYYIGMVTGDYDNYLAMMSLEKAMNLDELYPPHMTAFTNNGDNTSGDSSKPTINNPKNENTIKSKTNSSKNIPKPSK